MKIQILGSGCPKCKQTEANARQAAKELGLDVEIEKITDINEITDFGIIATPGLAVDDKIKFSGKIPSIEEVKEVLK
jgi:small redox-active disulfide protein 2